MDVIINILFKPLFHLINFLKAKEWLTLTIIFILNLAVKLTIIDVADIDLNESLEIDAINKPIFCSSTNQFGWTVFEPLYRIILWLWAQLTGYSVYGLRSLSAVFLSIASVVLYKGILKYVNFRVACWVSLFYLINNIFTQSSQEISNNSLIILLSVLSSFHFIKLYNNPNFKSALKLTAINCLLFYTSNAYVSLIFVQLLISIFIFKNKFKYILTSFGLLLVGCNYWLVNYFLQNDIILNQFNIGINLKNLSSFFYKNFTDYFFFNVFFALTIIIILNVYVKKLNKPITKQNGLIFFYFFISFSLFYLFIFKSKLYINHPFEIKSSLFLALSLTVILGFIFGYTNFSSKINLLTFILLTVIFAPSIKLGQNKNWPSKAIVNIIKQHQNSKTAFFYDNYLPFTFYLDPTIFNYPKPYLNNLLLKNLYPSTQKVNYNLNKLNLLQYDTLYIIHQTKKLDSTFNLALQGNNFIEVKRFDYYGNYHLNLFNRKK